MRTDTWKAVVLLLLATFAGAAVGSVVTSRMHGEHRDGAHGHRGSDWYMDLLKAELQLTAAQQDSVRQVLDHHRGAMDSLWADVGARMDAMRQAIRADVRTLLTPAQRERYAALTARLDAERRDSTSRDSTNR
ncbi:MAG: periplasmic heavy metal sensor [Gemmatimonadetes bacterium]|jgi:hypothetical protein|nr:periplasmic heavy metal sensor [Gemmatimonadota bacterium]MBP6669700.1 periplasmic heavy metal sensor [Gemmatimonadales bacterium]MBK6780500.1 periplasmic heavy metal sensor [Gemmatimonadota bacterium]MBK7351243.1 periplasmic heavy metal sensor [Gemmatimonadota bacterium]MBK7715221.1 periplasmic heavy metal sensor [Gemmatimonadota bacterium]